VNSLQNIPAKEYPC